MKRKLFRSGNSLVVSFPPDWLKVLELDVGDEVQIELDWQSRGVYLCPADVPGSGVTLHYVRQVDEAIEQYRSALGQLAN